RPPRPRRPLGRECPRHRDRPARRWCAAHSNRRWRRGSRHRRRRASRPDYRGEPNMTTSPTAIPALARANELALVAAFAALIVALGAISIPVPGSSVPVTGQTLGVLLAANVLGGRRAFMAVGLVL